MTITHGFVAKVEDQYIRYSSARSHTGEHYKLDLVDELDLATIFYGPYHLHISLNPRARKEYADLISKVEFIEVAIKREVYLK